MLKKTMLLAAAVAALAALVVPAAANASARDWLHNNEPLSQPIHINTHGFAEFESSAGGIRCETTSTVILKPGSTGTVKTFHPKETGPCTYSGNLNNLCGVVDAHTSTAAPGSGGTNNTDLRWVIHATTWSSPAHSYGITVTNVHVDVGGTGIFCPDVTVKGDVTLTSHPDPTNREPTYLSIEGNLESNLGTEVEAGGTQHITPAGTISLEENATK